MTVAGSMTVASGSVLTQTLLDRCRERAPRYDRDNTFCQEDFDELKAAGYYQIHRRSRANAWFVHLFSRNPGMHQSWQSGSMARAAFAVPISAPSQPN